jgi:hypothetical protein
MDDYDLGPLRDLHKINDPKISSSPVMGYFIGERGSAYAQHKDGLTTGYRKPTDDTSNAGKTLQPSSSKTLFMEPRAVDALHSWITDEYIGTQLEPVMNENGKLSHVEVHSTDDVPRRGIKKGQVLSKIPATTQVAKGLQPVEFHGQSSFVSPVGSKTGKEVHYGSPVAKIIPSPTNKVVEKENAVLQHGSIHSGAPQLPNIKPLPILAKGGKITMPENYRAGGRTSLI